MNERQQVYQRPDGTYEDYYGNPIDPEIQNMSFGRAAAESGLNTLHNMGQNLTGMIPGEWNDIGPRSPEAQQRQRYIEQLHPIPSFVGGSGVGMFGLGSKKKAADRVISGLEGVVMGNPDDPMAQRFIEGLAGREAGDYAGQVLGRIANFMKRPKGVPEGKQINKDLAEIADKEDWPLTPAQRTGADELGDVERNLESRRFTRGMAKANEDVQQEQLAKKLGEFVGLPQGKLDKMTYFDDDSLRDAQKLLKARFNRIGKRLPDIEVDEALADTLRGDALTKKMRYILKKQDGIDIPEEGPISLSGDAAMKVRSKIVNSLPSDPSMEDILYNQQLLKEFDDAIESFIPEADLDVLEEWSDTRKIWRRTEALDMPSMRAEGNYPPKVLYNAIRDLDEQGDEVYDSMKNVAKLNAAQALKLPYNYSNTAGASRGLLGNAASWLEAQSGLPAKYYEKGAEGTLTTGLLNAALSEPDEMTRYLARGLGRSYGAGSWRE